MAVEVSVVIPTYNRKEKLTKTLDSLSKQDFPKEKFEVVIVDDGSEQDVHSVVESFKRILDIKYIKQKKEGPGIARNRGVEIAQGSIICFTDDDCMPERNWLGKFYNYFKDNRGRIIGGLTKVRESNLKALLAQFMANGAINAYIGREKKIIFLPTSNVGLKREIFKHFTFNPCIRYPGGEDLEFFWRIFQAGYNLAYYPDIQVLHLRNENFKEFLFQPFIYGRGNYWVKKFFPDHPALQELKNWKKILHSLTQIPLYSLHIAMVIARSYHKNLLAFITLFFYAFIYRLAYLGGYCWEGFKNAGEVKNL